MFEPENTPLLFSEMSIVDVFTKVIFDPDTELDETEELVMELLAHVDSKVAIGSRIEISECLRSMAVDEMIQTVAKVKRQIDQQPLIASAVSGSLHSIYR